ncbi:MAG TPA: radical SAM protein [Vicinamibacteria bacterium]|nr:radical SAM protein [Vicinamibacteria bacterium]
MKVLFVSTRKNSSPEDRELYEMDFMNGLLGFKRSLLDLGLLTVAACTPADVEVEMVDEYVEEIPYDTDADLVALSAKTSCVTHAYEVAAEFRRRGRKVVLGGIHASLRPEEATLHVDHVVVGEAEKTWPLFVQAFRKGEAPRVMPDAGFAPMDEIPVPAWDRIRPGEFLFHQLQTTRGCPFMCRFCSVPDISGQSFRFKPVERVVEEIRALPRSGPFKDRLKALYIVDDNFISKVPYTKELLRALVPLHASGELREWSAETTLNVSRDEELLDLFRAAGCSTLIVGFESISEATLLEMDKKVNFCLTYQEAIARIHRRGMSIVGNFIVGFDTDTVSVFRDLLDFIDEHTILYPFFSILTPMPGTKLHEDYKAAGRLDHLDWSRYDTRHVVFEPVHMTRDQLMDGYCWLYEEAYASVRALDRLQRYWTTWRGKEAGWLQKAAAAALLWRHRHQGSPRFRRLLREGQRRLWSHPRGDAGQLFYYLDSGHFCDYLDRFRSARYAENVRVFRGEVAPEPVEERLRRKQWERKRPAAATAS